MLLMRSGNKVVDDHRRAQHDHVATKECNMSHVADEGHGGERPFLERNMGHLATDVRNMSHVANEVRLQGDKLSRGFSRAEHDHVAIDKHNMAYVTNGVKTIVWWTAFPNRNMGPMLHTRNATCLILQTRVGVVDGLFLSVTWVMLQPTSVTWLMLQMGSDYRVIDGSEVFSCAT